MIVYDSARRPITLGPELYRGGEGAIYPVQAQSGAWSSLVAKIYTPAAPSGYDDKLAWMKANPPADPSRATGHASIAWPMDLIYNSAGKLNGYVMPHIRNTAPLLVVFNPRSRARTLPGFDWKYLHRAARNLAAALAALHARDYVVGDLNESNVLITPTALVTMIDTDSFQVHEQGLARIITYPCPVGKPEYTPPELQGKTFRGLLRRSEHDCFGLGVLIFQLLMEGSHPFRAQWLGSGDPPSIEERIAKGWFPHAIVKSTGGPVAPPPNTLALQTLHPAVAGLAQRCFVDGHPTPALRPKPNEWEQALAEAEQALVKCANGHFFSGHLRACPRCGARSSRRQISISTATPAATSIPAMSTVTAPPMAPPAHTASMPANARMQAAWQATRSRVAHLAPTVTLPAALRFNAQRLRARLEQSAAMLWAAWTLATVLGWVLGALVAGLARAIVGDLAGNMAHGVVVGFAQWLVLRRRMSTLHAIGWVLATASGYGIGASIDIALGYTPPWLVTALLAGAVQAGLLWLRIRHAPWWILANAVGWLVAFAFGVAGASRDSPAAISATLATGAISGAVTGVALVWLLQLPPDLMRWPSMAQRLRARVPWRAAGAIAGLGMLAVAGASIGLKPCGWLDVTLKLSKCVRALAQPGPVWDIAFSPDGSMVAAESTDHTIRLWRAGDGALAQTLTPRAGSALADLGAGANLVFSGDGASLVALAGDAVQTWQVADGTLMRAQKLAAFHSANERISSAQLSPDGATLALAVCDKADSPLLCKSVEIRLWRAADGEFIGALKGHVDPVRSMAFSPDGKLLVSGSCNKFDTGERAEQCKEGEVLLWRLRDEKLLYEVHGHTDWVSQLAFSNDGMRFASGADDGTVQIWRVNGGVALQTLRTATGAPIKSLAFAPKDAALVAGANPLAAWQLPDGVALNNGGPPGAVSQVAVSPGGAIMAALSADDQILLWRLR